MRKSLFNIDEREKNTFYKICTVLYFVTLYALMGILAYREFVLHQSHQLWDDFAILMTSNVIVLLGAILYLTGGVNPAKIKLRYIVAGFLGFVLIGFSFTIFKYAVIEGLDVNLAFALDKMKTIIVISGSLALVLGVLAYLGNRRIEKHIE